MLFFQVPPELLPKYELEREQHQRQRQVALDGRRKHDMGRRSSYADLESYLRAPEQLELDEDMGDPGSCDQKVK